ncbi:MAG: exonuclease domain-containing protein [Sulfurospirillum sp.]
MDFIAIDVETANADLSSICQIGLAFFKDGKIIDTWETLINPEEEFDPINISIHGIDYSNVKDAPTFNDIIEEFIVLVDNNTLVSHMSFDRVAIYRAFEKISHEHLNSSWIDSAMVVRRTWNDLSKKGYGLANVAKKLDIKFEHHNALEDAKTCGIILVKALTELSMDLTEVQTRVKQSIDGQNNRINLEGNPDGNLNGEVLVFTGALMIPRREAAKMAADAGCDVSASVKKSVTILVIGDQDTTKLAGHKKSSKHRKAEELIQKGQNIKIIGESDFKAMVGIN